MRSGSQRPQKADSQTSMARVSIRATAYLKVGPRRVLLVAQPKGPGGVQIYEGKLLPGVDPLSLKGFAKSILGETFHVELPDSFPDIVINTLDGQVTRTPKTSGKKPHQSKSFETTYRFEAASSTSISRPFGSMVPVAFKGFRFVLEKAPADTTTALFLRSKLDFGDHLKWLEGAGATLVVASGAMAAQLTLTRSVSPVDLIQSLLSVDLGNSVRDFLPKFSPRSPARPLRLAYASRAITAGLDGREVQYRKGLTVEDGLIKLFDSFSFAVSLSVDNGFSLTAGAETIDLGFLKLFEPGAVTTTSKRGPELAVARVVKPASESIALKARLEFFGEVTLDLIATYQRAGKSFDGQMTYQGSILGIEDPTLDISWSRKHGFRLKNFPIPTEQLDGIIDFAREFEQLSREKPGGKCDGLADLAFEHTVKTKFSIHVSPRMKDGSPAAEITGAYTVFILGHSIAGIEFEPVDLPITVPKSFDDLSHAIIETLGKSAKELAAGLWDNKKKLAEFLSVVMAKKLSSKLIGDLACHSGGDEELEKRLKKLAEDAAKEAAKAALETLEEAAKAVAAAVAALSFFARIFKCLSDEQKEQNRRARQRQAEAQAAISELLKIRGLAVSYHSQGETVKITAGWKPVPSTDPTVGYLLGVNVPDHRPEIFAEPAALLPVGDVTHGSRDRLSAGQTYEVRVIGQYVHNHQSYHGEAQALQIEVPILAVTAPGQTYDDSANSWTATWQPSPGFDSREDGPVRAESYEVGLWDQVTDQQVNGMTATLDARSANSGEGFRHVFHLLDENARFLPEDGPRYQVRLRANANVRAFTSEVWKSAPVSLPAGVGHSRIGSTFRVKEFVPDDPFSIANH